MRHSVPTNEGKKYRPIQFYTGMSIAPEEWDSEAGRACTRHNKEKGQRACIDHLYINSTLERLYDRCRLLTEEIRGKEFDGVREALEFLRVVAETTGDMELTEILNKEEAKLNQQPNSTPTETPAPSRSH